MVKFTDDILYVGCIYIHLLYIVHSQHNITPGSIVGCPKAHTMYTCVMLICHMCHMNNVYMSVMHVVAIFMHYCERAQQNCIIIGSPMIDGLN